MNLTNMLKYSSNYSTKTQLGRIKMKYKHNLLLSIWESKWDYCESEAREDV